MHGGMCKLELAYDPPSVCGDKTEEEDAEETRNKTEDSEGLR
jgi:hypothetical protein